MIGHKQRGTTKVPDRESWYQATSKYRRTYL